MSRHAKLIISIKNASTKGVSCTGVRNDATSDIHSRRLGCALLSII